MPVISWGLGRVRRVFVWPSGSQASATPDSAPNALPLADGSVLRLPSGWERPVPLQLAGVVPEPLLLSRILERVVKPVSLILYGLVYGHPQGDLGQYAER